MLGKYKVYVYLDPRDRVPRYVGQGAGKRYLWWKGTKSKRQSGVVPWLQELKSCALEPIVQIVAYDLTQDSAWALEILLIAQLGRTMDGSGSLLNQSTGGKSGGIGFQTDPEWRRKKAATARLAFARPSVKQRHSDAMKAAWQRPGVKQRWVQAIQLATRSPGAKKRWVQAIQATLATPESKEHRSKVAKAALARPEVRQRHLIALRATSVQRVAAIKATYARPEVRQRLSAAVRRALADPKEKRRKSKAMKARWVRWRKLHAKVL